MSDQCEAKALLTPSATSALEAAVILSGVKYGDEVILPSFAYPTCASSIIRAGGVPVFVDIKPGTLNIDPDSVYPAITNRTKAVMAIWYAGVPEAEKLKLLCDRRSLKLIEDAAQCIGNFKLTGDFAAISFHRSKNIHCGEGGVLLCKEEYLSKARTLCACGTNRWSDKTDWNWLSVGSSYLMSEILARHLWIEIQKLEDVNSKRLKNWKIYHDVIKTERKAKFPGNGHIFWFLTDRQEEFLKLGCVKHYEALHLTKPGIDYGRFHMEPIYSEHAAHCIVRPPMTLTPLETLELAEQINRRNP